MEKRLVTSALPYVNNIPHLGNLIQMLSGDVFSRFSRSRGYDTLYICGTDEYGTATETRALEEGKTPRELCDYYFTEHKKIYDWFNIAFDRFGRTSNAECTETTQSLFHDLEQGGFITEHTTKQLYCEKCGRFLADRYVRGTCPKCGRGNARGDQCEDCGTLLNPTELVNPKCSVCGSRPVERETKHLYLNLPKMSGMLDEWMKEASVQGRWSENAINITKAWIRDGLRERAITRDLKWGIPIPKVGYENKVFYVWFNASIGYISITRELARTLKERGEKSFDYREWWIPSEVETKDAGAGSVKLFQFIGKDNIPFHTVIFPCTLLGSPHNWTKLFHMSATEYLNYEDKKFSKSAGTGVFGTDAQESGIKADAWRFYIFYNRPEKQDFQFTWTDFQEKLNSTLVGNLGNFVNRTLLFVQKYYAGTIPLGETDNELWKEVREKEKRVTELLEWAELKDAFHEIFSIADLGNKEFQRREPWHTRTANPKDAENLIYNLCYLIKDLMILTFPFMPTYSEEILSYFGLRNTEKLVGKETISGLDWSNLGEMTGLGKVGQTKVFFTPMDKKTMEAFREKFSGTAKKAETEPFDAVDFFNKKVNLVVAKILTVERNPESDKLYIEHLDDGSGTERIIQSGLVGYLSPDDLVGKKIVLAENLAPRKMRGVLSRGMLLAVDYKTSSGNDAVEVLSLKDAAVGTQITLEGENETIEKPREISADDYFKVPIKVVDGKVNINGKSLSAGGEMLVTHNALNGDVH